MERGIVADSEPVSGRADGRRRWRTVEEKRRIVEEATMPVIFVRPDYALPLRVDKQRTESLQVPSANRETSPR